MSSIRSHLEQLQRRLAERTLQDGGAAAGLRAASMDLDEQDTLDLLAMSVEALGDAPSREEALRDVVRLLGQLSAPWAAQIARGLSAGLDADLGDEDAAALHHLEVGRRLLAAHTFLAGHSGDVDYQSLTTSSDGDIRIGLGLGLKDGGLPKLLLGIIRRSPYKSSRLALRPFFDAEADTLAHLIESRPEQLTDYLRSHLVLRHDAQARRLTGSLPDAWRTRLGRLGVALNARQLQLELTMGQRLASAKTLAQAHGIQSLRGLAVVFEAQPLLQHLTAEAARATEAARALDPSPRALDPDVERARVNALALQALSMVEGRAAQRWSERLRSLSEGRSPTPTDARAPFDPARPYDEAHLLGHRADLQPWRYEPAQALSAPLPPPPSPKPPLSLASRYALPSSPARLGQAPARAPMTLRATLHEPQPQAEPPARGALLPSAAPSLGQRLHLPAQPLAAQPQRAPRAAAISDAISRRLARGAVPALDPQLVLCIDGDHLTLPGRSVGPLTPPQLEQLRAAVADLDPEIHCAIQASITPDGYQLTSPLTSQHGPLLSLSEENIATAFALYPDDDDPLAAFTHRLAAELRGDVILSPSHTIPLGLLPDDPSRRRWLADALRSADLTADTALILALDPTTQQLQAATADGAVLITFCAADIEAIRQRPGRRLYSLSMPTTGFALQAAHLWISDLRGDGVELLVPPVRTPRHVQVRPADDALSYLLPPGAPVFAMAPGVICHAAPTGASGLAVLIDHGHGMFTRYAHLGTLNVRPGQAVNAEQLLGRCGLSEDDAEPRLICQAERRPSLPPALLRAWRIPNPQPVPLAAAFGQPTHPWQGITLHLTHDATSPT
jgi:hypothetical protein